MFFAIILNFLTSYFISTIFNNIIILFISFFALIILNIEILSLFSAICPIGILSLNIIFFVISLYFFKKYNFPKLQSNFNFNKFKNSLILDKTLFVLSISFVIFILVQLFLSTVMPTLEPDSQTYHFLRAVEFVHQKNLNHFDINDARALVMPINSEIIYSYFLTFKKNFYGFGLISFFALFINIISGWNILEQFKFSYRKRLYSIFLFTSLSAIIIQSSTLQTDLFTGSLILSSYALFLKSKKYIYFSSLAFAIALGVKSTSFICLGSFLVLIYLSELLINKNKNFNKLKLFILFLILNFIIFSSYNYILNYIQFNGFFSNQAMYQGHRFWGGIQGYIANLINYAFQGIDFTGFKWGYYLNNTMLLFKQQLFDLIHIDKFTGCNMVQDRVNIIAEEQISGFGILGFLIFLPTIFKNLIKIFFNKNKRTILLFLLSLTFILNILFLSCSVAYMVYSTRFIVTFVCLSFIVFASAYKTKGLFRFVILFFSMFYMILLSTHIKRMPFFIILKNFKNANYNLEAFSENCYREKVVTTESFSTKIYQTIKEKYKDKKNIAFIKKTTSSALYLKKLYFEGYNITYFPAGNLTKEKLNEFDLVILEDKMQNDDIFNDDNNLIKYKILDKKIIFDDNDDIKCYLSDIYGEIAEDTYEAINRTCFTYNFVQQHLKLDYEEKFKVKYYKDLETIYYFVK